MQGGGLKARAMPTSFPTGFSVGQKQVSMAVPVVAHSAAQSAGVPHLWLQRYAHRSRVQPIAPRCDESSSVIDMANSSYPRMAEVRRGRHR